MTLTEKDKKLLYFLCILLIAVVFGFFIIKPQITRRTELEDRLSESEAKQSSMKVAIAGDPASRQIIEETKTEYNQVTKDFYPLMISNQIEPLITEKILNHGLTSLQLEVASQPEIRGMSPYFASMMAQEMAVDSAEGEENSDSGEAQNGESPKNLISQGVVYTSDIKVVVSGTRENMEALIDEISNDCPAIRITSFQMNTKTGISAGNQVQETSTLTLGMELYMCAKE